MYRVVFLIFLIYLQLDAKDLNKKRFTLFAKNISSKNGIITANGDVTIYSKDSTFRANRVVYHKKSSLLELFGDVFVSDKSGNITRLENTTINLKSGKFESKNPFIYNQASNIWFHTNEIDSNKSIYRLKKSTLSSCDRSDPDWRIEFSKGTYNKEKEYVVLTNPRFYVKNTPVLYLPWFGFPTAKERKSGFLKPILGFESRENIFFVLPYYIVNQENWDLEIDPQIRLDRGEGLYTTFRFLDSNHSAGKLNIGLFHDKRSYQREHNLQNSTHYGVNFLYRNSSIFSDKSNTLKKNNYRDALWADITYLNDIDFINLDHKNSEATSKLVTSRINYLLFNEKSFFGIYNKYFIDTEKNSNSDTLQTLPSIQHHLFSDRFKIPNILYSLDYKFKNNYRRKGLNAKQHELLVPITFSKTLFGDFINFQISENLYYARVDYSNEKSKEDYANYFSNYHKFELSSDLTKKYSDYIHNIQFDTSFVVPSSEKKSGYFADFIPFNLETKNVSLKLNEYFYRPDGYNFISHRLVQVFYDDNRFYKYGDLENQLIYRPNRKIKIENTTFYSHQFHRFKKVQTGINFSTNRYRFNVNHTYEYKENEKNRDFITSSFGAKIDRVYDIFGSLDYDIEDSFTKEWSFGWKMKKRCWDYMFRYKESVTPNLTSSGAESVVKRGVLLFVRFHPFGGMEYEFNSKSNLPSEELR